MKESRKFRIRPIFCNESGTITIKSLTGLMVDLAVDHSSKLVGLFYKKGQKKMDFKIGSEIDHAYGVMTYV